MFAGKTVSVVGAGTMGNGIAHVFALGGFNVNLIDLNSEILSKASATIDKNLQRQVSKEKITAEVAKETMERLNTHNELSAASDSFLIIEAVSENEKIKEDVFKKLDEIADDKKDDEFTCSVCFLVLRNTQLAKPRSKVCADCA